MEEIIKEKREKKEVWKKNNLEKNKPINLDKISNAERKRIMTADKELNRVLGGGVVPGSVILIHMPERGVREWNYKAIEWTLKGLKERKLDVLNLSEIKNIHLKNK